VGIRLQGICSGGKLGVGSDIPSRTGKGRRAMKADEGFFLATMVLVGVGVTRVEAADISFSGTAVLPPNCSGFAGGEFTEDVREEVFAWFGGVEEEALGDYPHGVLVFPPPASNRNQPLSFVRVYAPSQGNWNATLNDQVLVVLLIKTEEGDECLLNASRTFTRGEYESAVAQFID
jgi:hypothetical protein